MKEEAYKVVMREKLTLAVISESSVFKGWNSYLKADMVKQTWLENLDYDIKEVEIIEV